MGLDRVEGDKEPGGDLLVTQTVGHQSQHFELAGAEAQPGQLFFVDAAWSYINLLFHDDGLPFWPCQLDRQPDPQSGKHDREGAAIELDGPVEDDELPFEPIE